MADPDGPSRSSAVSQEFSWFLERSCKRLNMMAIGTRMLKRITIMMGLGHLVRRFFGGAGAILTFHRVRPVDETEFATGHLSTDPDVLERLIRTLKADSWDFVTLTQALERRRQAHARPFVCLTFDDGYRDNIDILLPVAARHGVPITIFATAGFIDRSHAMWWYGIEEILRHADELSITVKGETRRRAAGDMDAKRAAYAMAGRLLTGLAPADVATIVADLERRYGVDFLELTDRHAATWDMLREAARDPLVEIGAHTVSHAALGAADAATAAWEITAGRQRIESALGRPVVHFAYPYGDARAAGRREA